MADELYKRLSCIDCDSAFSALRRSAKRCLDCRAYKPAEKTERTCARCGIGYLSNRINDSNCCSKKCADAKRQKLGLNRLPKEGLKWSFNCENCSSLAYRCPSSTNKKRGIPNKYCSRKCQTEKNASLRHIAEEIKAIRRLRKLNERWIKQVQCREANRAKLAKHCAACGIVFIAKNACVRLCSAECRKPIDKSSESYKRNKRVNRKRYKMLKRCAVVESFDDIEILERDGWTCQICGIPTPKRLRGTYKPNAPEVDHIVAITKGGAHARWNVQCACRSCNGLKKDGPPIGQMGLFSGPIDHTGGVVIT